MGEEMMKSMGASIGMQGHGRYGKRYVRIEGMKEIGKAMADMGMETMALNLYQLLLQIQNRYYRRNVRNSWNDKFKLLQEKLQKKNCTSKRNRNERFSLQIIDAGPQALKCQKILVKQE
jgi:hypothetical protein